MARIAANVVGCLPEDIIEIDGATKTGIGDMREVQELTLFRPLSGSDARVVICDECQKLSSSAWDSLLKVTEEPPEWMYWFFCTTNPSKVPSTIKTRAATFTLKPVPDRDIQELLTDVSDREKFVVTDPVIELIVREALGSPRQALNYLGIVSHVKDRKTAAELLRSTIDSEPVNALCKLLLNPTSWAAYMDVVKRLDADGTNAEGVRIVVMNYMSKVAQGSTKDESAIPVLSIMEQFCTPYVESEKMAPLIISIGRCHFR